MKLVDILYVIGRRLGLFAAYTGIDQFAGDAHAVLAKGDGDRSRVARLFYAHDGQVIHKWDHYLDLYDRYFSRFAGTPVRMLEIGVFKGGSLQLWRKYLGEQATIFGIDIDPACAALAQPPNEVRIGSQDDPQFLRGVVQEMGGVDIVLDDGSHYAAHQRASFKALFPLLADGGLYVIEDVHTAYWRGRFEGGYRRRGTAIELAKDLIDDLHVHYHSHGSRSGQDLATLASVCVHDSLIVIEKRRRDPPCHVKVGRS